MKQVSIRKAYDLVIDEVEIPEPGGEQVVVKIAVCGLCATDIHSYEGESIQGRRYPFHPGHEIAGVIYAVGNSVTNVAVGDRVVVDPLYPCEKCEFCRANKQNHCLQVKTLGTTGPGGFSDYTVVPAKNVYKLNKISFNEAAFAEPLSTVLYGSARAEIKLGDRILINGAGPIGLLHLQVALISGCSEVWVTDLKDQKLDKAQKFGASGVILASRPGADEQLKTIAQNGFDVIIDCTGVPGVIERSLNYLKNAGRLLIFGVCPQNSEIKLNPFEIYRRDLKIIGAYALNRTMQATVELLEAQKILVTDLIAEILPRTRLLEAMEKVKQGKVDGKILIIPED